MSVSGKIVSGGYVASGATMHKWLTGEHTEARPVVRNAADALSQVVPLLTDEDGGGLSAERLVVVALDRKGRVIAAEILTVGSDCATVVDTRQILRWALLKDAVSIVLAHNHPSGDPDPSVEDQLSTRKVATGCAQVGIRLLDHLIVCGYGCWVSMMERGVM